MKHPINWLLVVPMLGIALICMSSSQDGMPPGTEIKLDNQFGILNASAFLMDDVYVPLFDISMTGTSAIGGKIEYLIHTDNGNNQQAKAGTVAFSVVKMGISYAYKIKDPAALRVLAKSSGTLNGQWRIVSATDKITIEVKQNTSLSLPLTEFRIHYKLVMCGATETVTIR